MNSIVDLIDRSYIYEITKNMGNPLWVITGFSYYPLVGSIDGVVLRVLSVAGASLYPLSLSLLFPIFLYLIVLDKEGK